MAAALARLDISGIAGVDLVAVAETGRLDVLGGSVPVGTVRALFCRGHR